MRAKAEYFKGIEFVRISSLPQEQQEKIWDSFQHDKIIKIIRDQALLNDCILYRDYANWFGNLPAEPQVKTKEISSQVFGKLAFE